MADLLHVPRFARLDEYWGAWAMEPERFLAQYRLVLGTDLLAHARQAAAAPQPARSPNVELVPGRAGKSVALVRVLGTLMKQASSFGGTSTIQLRRDVRQAAADPNVTGILLAIDSPGGTVAGTADLANEVRQARRAKPVWAHIDDLGASAAYWVASQADQVFANAATAWVGSIGTIQTVYDLSQAAEREGIKTLVFSTGPLKGAGAPGTEVTEEQRAYFQSLVEDAQQSFDAAVRSGRGMTAAQLAAVRTGGVFPAGKAVGLRLIDGIRALDKTLDALAAAK